jgi:hypothetical protein
MNTEITKSKRPVKTEGYAHAPFGGARREVRRAEAKARQAKHDALTVKEKLRKVVDNGGWWRPVYDSREFLRLDAQLAATNNQPKAKA